MFSPGLGFYGNGLIHLLGNLSRAATANLRQLIDSGTLANMPSGFKARGLRIKNDDEPLRPGEWRDVDVVGDQLKNSFFNLPYQEPSGTLFQLLGFVVSAAQKFVGTTDMGTGNTNQEMPVGTTIALLERGSRIISAVHKRIYNSLKQEFSLLATLISQEGGAYPYTEEGDKAKDFDARIDIVPIANPNIFSMAQRISLAQEQLKLASSKPEMHNLYEAYRRVYISLGVDNIEQLLPPPPEAQPMNAIIENGKAMSALGGQMQLKAFPEQNHDAHISTHLSYMGSLPIKSNPAMINILQQHIFENISLKAQQQLQNQAQQQPMDEMTAQAELSQIEAELTKQYFEMESQVLGGSQTDPLVDLKSKELQIKEQQVMQDAQNEQEKLKLNQEKLQANTAIQKDRIDTTEEIANMRAQNARFITAQRNKG